jgi:Flp pilus assembly protein TadB
MRNIISRYIAVLWLLAALSLVGWLLVNLDVAGWILVILTIGLMTWELTTRKSNRGGRSSEREPFGRPDERPH